MRAVVALLAAALSASVITLPAASQTSQDAPHLTPRATAVPKAQTQAPAQSDPPAGDITVPAGTKIPLTLKQGINTRSARPGDPVYAQTAFPIIENNQIVIPVGTFVQGEVRRVVRPGRVKGRAQLQLSFTSMIFPNGYTVMVQGKEGTIHGPGSKGKDAGTIAEGAGTGALIGALANGGRGAAIGAGAGGVLGLATVLLTRGPEVELGTGASVEMELESGIHLDLAKTRQPAYAE